MNSTNVHLARHRWSRKIVGLAVAASVLLGACAADGQDAQTSTTVTSTTSTEATVATSTTTEQSSTTVKEGTARAVLRLRPVRTESWTEGCDRHAPAPRGIERVPSENGATCYELGPSDVDSSSFETVRVSSDHGVWGITVTIRQEDRSAVNHLFNGCFRMMPWCPTKRVAIVMDDVLLSAPEVNGEDLANDELLISGNFTRREAEDLAARMTD